MKRFILLLAVFALCLGAAQAEQLDIVGCWEVESLTVEGETIDIRETGMNLLFEFTSDGWVNSLNYADWEYEASEETLTLKHAPTSFDLFLSPFTDEDGKFAEKHEYALDGDMLALSSDFLGNGQWELYRAQSEGDGLVGRWDFVTTLFQEDYERYRENPDSVDLTEDTSFGSAILMGMDGYIEFFEGGAFRWTSVAKKATAYRIEGETLLLDDGVTEKSAMLLSMEDGRLVLTERERYFDGEDWIESEDGLCLVPVQREEVAEVFVGMPFANDTAAEDIIVPIKSAGNIEYRCIGRFAGTDKYALDPGYRVSADARKSEWSYDGDEGDPIYFMFVSGVVNSAEQMIDLMKSAYEEESEDGVWSFTGTQGAGVSQAGLDYRYLCTAVIQTEADDAQGHGWQYEYTRHLYAYVVVGEEACVLVTVYGGAKSQDEVPGQDVLLERAIEFIDLISLPENLEYATAWNADVTVQTGERQASVSAYESIVGKWMLRELAFNEDVRRSGSSFEGLLFEFTPEGEILYHDVTSFTYRYDEENVWLGAATLSQYMLMEGREQAVSYTLCGDRLLLKGLWGNDAGHLFTRLSEGEAMYGEWGLARPLDQEEMERFLQAPDDFEYEPADLGNLRVTVEITAEGSFTVTWTIEFLYYRLLEENMLALCEAPDAPTDMTLQYVLEDGKLTLISEDTLPETGEVMNLRAVLERAE